jgi:hypothetical protein
VAIRIEAATLIYDLHTGELLCSRKNPLRPDQVKGLGGSVPPGSRRGARRTHPRAAEGLQHRHQHDRRPGCRARPPVSDTTLAIEITDGDVKVARRTTIQPVATIMRAAGGNAGAIRLVRVAGVFNRRLQQAVPPAAPRTATRRAG